MDGLEIKEININDIIGNKDKRLDSQFWTSNIIKNQNYEYKKIGELLKNSQYGISVEMNSYGVGYPIFRMNEIHNMLTDLEVEKFANITEQEYQCFVLNDRDVLFNRTNSFEWVGRTGIYYKNDTTPFTYASYLVKFVTNNNVLLPEYLVAFLNCKYGKQAIKARARQSINQTNVNPEEVKAMEIPLLSMRFQEAITALFIEANKKRVASKGLYLQANRTLEKEICFFAIKNKKYSIKTLSNSFKNSGRLDAEYYQPKYEELETNIKAGKYKVLKELAEVQSGEFIEESNYGNIGCSYIRGSDITNNIINFSDATKVNVNIDKYKNIDKNDIAFAMIGSVGNVAINKKEKCIVSNNLGAIKPFNKNNSNYLLLVLTSKIGQLLFEKYQTRTAQPKIRKEDVDNFVIPLLDADMINEINNKIEESFKLKEQAKSLLDNAVKAVEMAIETDEETALKWLGMQQ